MAECLGESVAEMTARILPRRQALGPAGARAARDVRAYLDKAAPFLAELASRGTVFDHAFSTSTLTAPATASFGQCGE